MSPKKAAVKRIAAVKPKVRRKVDPSAHIIPGRPPDVVLNEALIEKGDYRAEDIRRYVDSQTPSNENVTFLEYIKTERVLNEVHECWNVHTNKAKYWVITNLTNLYSHDQFPSLDYTITFHVGLRLRMTSDGPSGPRYESATHFASVFRRLDQISDQLETSEEVEDFQAVGMKCRECLVEFVDAMRQALEMPPIEEAPKDSDFIHWSQIFAEELAHGSSRAEIRGYLRTVSKSTWQLVSWLTHARGASAEDGEMALNAVGTILTFFLAQTIRKERGRPDTCKQCKSLKLYSAFNPDHDPCYIHVCQSCGWSEFPEAVPKLRLKQPKS